METYHAGGDSDEWLDDTAAVCFQILELADRVVDLDRDVEARRRQGSRADGYPTRSLGGGGAPTNLLHNFATGEDVRDIEAMPDDDVVSIPQHSDPTGEAAVRDPAADELGRLRRDAKLAALDAMRALERAVSVLSRAWPSPSLDDASRDRSVCWLCEDAGVHGVLLRESDGKLKPGCTAGANGRPPCCRNHADWFRSHGWDPPGGAAELWARGKHATPALEREWEAAVRAQRQRSKGKHRKGKRR